MRRLSVLRTSFPFQSQAAQVTMPAEVNLFQEITNFLGYLFRGFTGKAVRKKLFRSPEFIAVQCKRAGAPK